MSENKNSIRWLPCARCGEPTSMATDPPLCPVCVVRELGGWDENNSTEEKIIGAKT